MSDGNGNGERPSTIPVAFPREGRRTLPEIVTEIPEGATDGERAAIYANALLAVGEHVRDMRDRIDTVEMICRQILQHLRSQ